MTALTDAALAGALLAISVLCLATIDTAVVAAAAGCDPRLAAAIVLQSWGAVWLFVDAEAIDRLGVLGHMVARCILYPALIVVGGLATWLLGAL